MGNATVLHNVRSSGSVKSKKGSERTSISDRSPRIVHVLQQQLDLSLRRHVQSLGKCVNLLLNSFLNSFWMPVRNALSFAFYLSFDGTGAPNLLTFSTTVVIAHDQGCGAGDGAGAGAAGAGLFCPEPEPEPEPERK